MALLSMLALAAGPLACQIPIGPVRASTMPPDFTYIPPERVRSAMWVLAAEIQELERVLENPTESERLSQPSEVRARLARMRVAARTLDEPGRATQHPVLTQNLPRFIERIRRAESAAERNPPNFYPASTLAGSCFLCHGLTQATVDLERTSG